MEPQPFVELPEQDTTDTTALPDITHNNQQCRQDKARLTELQRWIRGRPQ